MPANALSEAPRPRALRGAARRPAGPGTRNSGERFRGTHQHETMER
jgi:hypothetical protein